MSPPRAGSAASLGASLIAQLVKNLPAMQETQVPVLGQEDPLEKEKATHSSALAWRLYSPWVTKSRTRLSDLCIYLILYLI